MNTKRLLKFYVRLRNSVATDGPSERLVVVRSLLNSAMQLYRLRRRYEIAKTKYPIHIESFETDKPLNDKDLANLKAATAVNQEITELLRERKGVRAKRAA